MKQGFQLVMYQYGLYYKMLTMEDTGYGVYGNTLDYPHNLSVNLKLL